MTWRHASPYCAQHDRAVTQDDLGGRLSRDRLVALLSAICTIAGLDARDAELIKFTNNAVFRLAHDPVVVRIAGSAAARNRIDKVVDVARWLADHSMPAVRLLPGVEQPLMVHGHAATLWQAIPAVGPSPTPADLAGILRQWHALPPPTPALPVWHPLDEIRQRLAEPEAISTADLGYLQQQCDAIEGELAVARYVLPSGPIHGDAFLGNLIPGRDGPVICDFDSTSHGPREWDLTPIAVGRVRFDYGSDIHGALASAYGFDVTTWDGFPVLRRLRELKLVTSVVPILGSYPSIRDQWQHRLETFRNGDTTAKWTTYQ